MSTPYDRLRSVLANGFYGENLRLAALLLAGLRRNEQVSPVACFVIEHVLLSLHARWFEQQPVTAEVAHTLECRLVKPLEATLDALDADPQLLIVRINELVRAYDACQQEVPTFF